MKPREDSGRIAVSEIHGSSPALADSIAAGEATWGDVKSRARFIETNLGNNAAEANNFLSERCSAAYFNPPQQSVFPSDSFIPTKMSNFHSRDRRAISPIVATVLIVAVTLVASIAIAGFVFGIFAQQGNSAQISVTATALLASTFTGASAPDTCAAAANSYLTLTNVGTASGLPSSVAITSAGATTSFTVTSSTACNVSPVRAASNTANILFGAAGANNLTPSPSTGNAYSGTVTMSNGAVLLFTGTFQ